MMGKKKRVDDVRRDLAIEAYVRVEKTCVWSVIQKVYSLRSDDGFSLPINVIPTIYQELSSQFES